MPVILEHPIELSRGYPAAPDTLQVVRQSRAFFREVWENSADGMRLTYEDGTVVLVNDAFCRMVNLTREGLEGKPLAVIYDPKRRDHILRQYRKRFVTRTVARHFDTQVTLWNGEKKWFEVANSFLSVEGAPVSLLGIFRDITARKKAEEERLVLEAKIQQAQKLESLGVLAGGIAHDFNNLLTSILGNASLALLKLPEDAAAAAFMREIETAGQRAAELTRQMLAYAGKGRFTTQPLHLSRTVAEITDLLRTVVSKKAKLHLALEEDLPPIQADAAPIRQVVLNLLTNSSEALGEQSGAITLKTGVMFADRALLDASRFGEGLPEGRYVFLEVSDTGCGMDGAILERIFDPFFSTKFIGRGLGLPAVLGIVRSHRGTIQITSQPGVGSTCRVLFPALGQAAATTAARRPGAGPVTILVIDDEDGVRYVARRILEEAGFQVLLARDGRDGLALYRQQTNQVAAVLLNLSMPDLNGEEVFQQLRQLTPNIPIVLMSGYEKDEVHKLFTGRNLTGFIQKPFRVSDLLTTIQDIVGKP